MDAATEHSLFIIASRAGMQPDEIVNCLQVQSLDLILFQDIKPTYKMQPMVGPQN